MLRHAKERKGKHYKVTFQTKVEFLPWPKTTRLFRDVVITEKIDGTNAAIQIIKSSNISHWDFNDGRKVFFDPQPLDGVMYEGDHYIVYAQSRNRLIFPGADNYGFAGWVAEHAAELVEHLGEGTHYGEWWGKGIGRNYGLKTRHFSLFNTHRFRNIQEESGDLVRCVPVLSLQTFDQQDIEDTLSNLKYVGSAAAPGFMNPEGICIYHTQTKLVQKVTLDNNDKGKWEFTPAELS